MKSKAIKYLNSLIKDETTKSELDIITYLKRLVNESKEQKTIKNIDFMPYFEILWKMYPRKIGKQIAIKQYEKKIRGLNEEEVKAISNQLYLKIKNRLTYWKENNTEINFIPHFSTFINAEIPNSKYFKGR